MSHPMADPTQRLIRALEQSGDDILAYVADQPLLQLALISMGLVLLGGLVRRVIPWLGSTIRFCGNLGLIGAMLAAMLHFANVGVRTGFGLGAEDTPTQTVTGKETRLTMGRDGHFWVTAAVNGVPLRFLIDTGATITTLSPDAADEAGLSPRRWGEKVVLNTANGPTSADMASIGELRVGNVVARNLQAVVAPGIGDTNVLGMNFLSRLASWRVEGKRMILVPHHPARSEDDDADGEAPATAEN